MRRRVVTNIWEAARELEIDIGNPVIAELIARPYIERADIITILEKPAGYRSSIAEAVASGTLIAARPVPGTQIEAFEPREVLEWLLNRDERHIDRDRDRLRRLHGQRRANDGS